MFLAESRSQELRVPVTRAEVEIRTNVDTHAAMVFLAAEGTLEDLFDDDSPFFPAQAGGRMRLFARSSVVSLSFTEPSKPADSEDLGLPYDARAIVVRLRNGTTLAGMLACENGRTLDFLNHPAKSFTLRADGKTHLVAKAHVEHIEEVR